MTRSGDPVRFVFPAGDHAAMTSQSDAAPTLHLTGADFDAWREGGPEKGASEPGAAEARLALKQRMLAWAREVVTRLAEIGIVAEVTASDGRRHGGQDVFFWRDAFSRAEIERHIERKRSLGAVLADPAPHHRHPFLQLRIEATHVEVSVELHGDARVDVRNLRALLGDPVRTLELTSALEALPFQFTLGLVGESERGAAAEATSDRVRELVARVERENGALWIGWTVPRDVAVTHSELLDEQLEDAIVALGPIEKLIAWAPDNDWIALGHESAVKDDRSRTNDAPRDRAATQARRDRVEHDQRKLADEIERDASEEPPKQESVEAPALPRRMDPIRAVPRTFVRRPLVTEVDPSIPIEKGTRVQVLAGPFRGKLGTVQELDGKGGARVILGLLATHLETRDLIAAAEGRDRPALASSHRKPIGVRS